MTTPRSRAVTYGLRYRSLVADQETAAKDNAAMPVTRGTLVEAKRSVRKARGRLAVELLDAGGYVRGRVSWDATQSQPVVKMY